MFFERSFTAGGPAGPHDIAYSEFAGDPNRTVICVHGLSRNGRDFDWLARALADDGHRVICPDMPGRNRSKPLSNPLHYNNPQYAHDCLALLAHLGVDQVDWVGTSMGGLIAMIIASQPHHPIRRLVINDIGPFITRESLIDIKTYVGRNPVFNTWADYYEAFKIRMATFDLDNDEQAQYLAMTSLETLKDGTFRLAYDTDIVAGLSLAKELTDIDLWPLWALVNVPTLIYRGADSAILSAETLDKMTVGKNDIKTITFPNVGHAPALMSQAQIQPIREFLR
ncbi:MAG TPA: alpha/beta hydrolase [Alphaproteobacteria bacterium]